MSNTRRIRAVPQDDGRIGLVIPDGISYTSRPKTSQIPPFAGQHYWMALVGYHVADPANVNVYLDMENLVSGPNIGCFYCEQPYTPAIAAGPCREA